MVEPADPCQVRGRRLTGWATVVGVEVGLDVVEIVTTLASAPGEPATVVVAFLGLPLTLNYPLHMGFFNFSYGCAVFFLAVGYHRRSSVPLI